MGANMYNDYFGFKESAFSITPDPRFLFKSEQHCEALAHLLYGVMEGGCFVLLTGEVGTGKTTICRTFLEQLPENVDVALLLNPPQSGQELLLAINDEIHVLVNHRDCSIHELIYLLTRRLLENHSQGRRTVVIIDEAQNIAPDVLEQVRLLTNLETRTEKLLHVVLVGQPELRELLMRPSLRQVAQRITARYHLEPLSAEETRDYIYHRLSVVNCRHGLFSDGAMRQIYRESRGVPRVINILCDRALLGAFANYNQHVTAKQIWQAARQWRGEQQPIHFWSKYRLAAALAAVGLLGTAAMVSAYVDEWQHAPLAQTVRLTKSDVAAHANGVEQGGMTPTSNSAHAANTIAQQSAAGQSAPENVVVAPGGGEAHTNDAGQGGQSAPENVVEAPAAREAHANDAEQDGQSTPENVVVAPAGAKAQPLPYGIRVIGPGSPPHAVRWLRRELDRIEGITTSENGPLFDEQLRARVMALQRNNGLLVDGIAGQQTLNYMRVIYGTHVSFNVESSQPRL